MDEILLLLCLWRFKFVFLFFFFRLIQAKDLRNLEPRIIFFSLLYTLLNDLRYGLVFFFVKEINLIWKTISKKKIFQWPGNLAEIQNTQYIIQQMKFGRMCSRIGFHFFFFFLCGCCCCSMSLILSLNFWHILIKYLVNLFLIQSHHQVFLIITITIAIKIINIQYHHRHLGHFSHMAR